MLSRLRPARIRAAARRRVFEYRLRRTQLVSAGPLVHLGSDYGGWYIPEGVVDASWTCYCVGAGSDVSFDLELIKRYGARVRSFDPFEVLVDMAKREAGDDPRFSVHAVAVAPEDGPVIMYGRQDLEHGSVSAVNLYGVETSFERPGRSLPSLMRELGDERLELLKLDVEGIEYDLLPRLDLAGMGVQVLCVELHHNRSVREARALLASLQAGGYEVVHRKEPTSFTLVALDQIRHATPVDG